MQTLGNNISSASPPPAGFWQPTKQRGYLWLFEKGEQQQLSANFSLAEFHCQCLEPRCHMTLVHPRLVESLQTLREILAQPLTLTSAFRCAEHNSRVGGRARSFHTRGMAADVLCKQPELFGELQREAARIPAVGAIGSYPERGFVHLDVRPRDENGDPERWSA